MAKQPLKNRYEQFCVDAKRLLDALGQKPTLSGRAMYEAACALATLHFPEDTELGGVGPRSLIWSLHPAVSGNDGGGSSGALAVAEVLRSIIEHRPPLDIKKRSDTHEERSRVYAQCPFYEQKRSYAIEKKLAFVLMPFKEPWSDRLWKQHLHPYLSDLTCELDERMIYMVRA